MTAGLNVAGAALRDVGAMIAAFAWGFGAAASLILGGLISLRFHISRKALGLVMAFGVGVLLSAVAYDLVANGNEIGGGSLRIHEPGIQARVFDVLQLAPEEQRAKFGFLLDALAMGSPPHGGIAFGIDRMLMVVAQEPNLRDVIAFPKNQAGIDPMSGAPSEVAAEQLDELGIRLVDPPA